MVRLKKLQNTSTVLTSGWTPEERVTKKAIKGAFLTAVGKELTCTYLTRGPEIGSRSALVVAACVLQLATSSSAPRARCYGKKVLDQLTFGTSCSMTKAVSSAGMLVRQRWRRSSTDGSQSLCFTRGMRRMLSLSNTSSILSSDTRTGHVSQP